ncbi:MAG: TonB-dependent receptor [Balneolaceae bacterium]
MLFLIFITSAAYSTGRTDDEDTAGTVSGIILDSETGEPVSFAYLHLEEINRTTTTDRNGRFRLTNIPEGSYTVTIHRIGYSSRSRSITVRDDETTNLEFEIRPTVLSGQAVQVTADAEGTTGSNLEHASVKIIGEQLRRDLGTTLSGTLDNQAGISERSMGAAPGRPVIRGLGDERVLILEDGERTGDVSWTSGDHAVAVDPSSADEIEIARGPAALEFGSGAIGGVINVVRNQIPNSVPGQTTGTLSLQGSTVNGGLMSAGSVNVPWNEDFVFNADLNGRIGSDYRLPDGRLPNTSLRSSSNSFGGSYIRPWGYTGLAGSMYLSKYGIPPDPDGGHSGGVDIEMSKYQAEGRAELLVRGPVFTLLETRASIIRYHHVEIEPGGIIGSQYDMDTAVASVKLRTRGRGILDSGVVGIWGEFTDYAVAGSRTPNSNAFSGALFAIQEADISTLHLEAGLRLNHATSLPEEERMGRIGHVRERHFTGLESSVSAIYDFGRGFFLGSTFMHSWRSPSLEELYSEGPHLAVYSFEVGNPDLDPERGLGSELFARFKQDNASIELTGYYNYFGNYLHAQNTGERRPPRYDLDTYQYLGTRATIYGAELSSEFQLHSKLAIDGNMSLTMGDRVVSEEEMELTDLQETEQPLPLIPPLQGNIALRYYAFNNFSISGRVRMAARQERLGEFETSTDGYTVTDLTAQYTLGWGTTLHTISVNALNLFNTEYHNHLSLVKDLFPEPGRSVNLLYRVYF